MTYIIEDESHSEYISEGQTLQEVMDELKRLAKIPWNKEPNQAPCIGWETCSREYVVIEYDNTGRKSRQVRRINALSVGADGIVWAPDFSNL